MIVRPSLEDRQELAADCARLQGRLDGARKRKAADSVNDKLTAIAETIAQLVAAQKQTVKGEQWHPVKFDSVVKQCVLGQDVDYGKTLRKDFAKDFKAGNGCETAECTVMKATWLSRRPLAAFTVLRAGMPAAKCRT
jgi:hypothetical protein